MVGTVGGGGRGVLFDPFGLFFFFSGSVSLARVTPPPFLAVTGFLVLFNILNINAKRGGS